VIVELNYYKLNKASSSRKTFRYFARFLWKFNSGQKFGVHYATAGD